MYKKNVKHSFKVFSENLKADKIDKVLLMFGPEQYLVKWAVETLVKKFVNPAAASMDYIRFSGDEVNCREIIEACETFSMFSERRIVWVRDFKPLTADTPRGFTKDDIKELIQYTENSNGGTILIFSADEIKGSTLLSSALKKNAQVYEFDKIDKGELNSFAKKRFKASGIEIGPAALSLLIETTGYFNKESDYRLFHFDQDIQKIIAHVQGNRVTEEDIKRTVHGDLETFVFDMLDAITANQKDRAFQILYNILYSGKDPFSIIGAIVSQFEMLLSVKQLREDSLDLSAMHKKLGGSEFRIKKLIPYANKYTVEKLKEVLSSAYQVDRQIKTGLLESQMALELFIAGI